MKAIDRQRGIELDQAALARFCRAHHVRRLSLFGSALRDTARPDSDLDLLVEFEPDAHVGLLEMAAMELELGELVRCRVDLRTPNDLSRYFRHQVLAAAEVLYAA